MTSNFIETFLYTNEAALKQYLTNSEITVTCSDTQSNHSLSDNRYGGILVFNNEVSIQDIKSKCCNDNSDTAVVIKLLLNKQIKVIGFDENGEQTEGEIGQLKNSIAYLIKDSIPFSNVASIIPVEKQLVFLQGDSTLYVPTNLIDKNLYTPVNCLSTDHLDLLLSKVKSNDSFVDAADDFLDDMDDFDIDSIDLSSINDQVSLSKDHNTRKNKLLAGLLMLVQGNHPLQNKLTANLYSLLDETTSFSDYVSKNIYKNMPFDITKYIETPNKITLDFFNELKQITCDNEYVSGTLFFSAISALLDLENDDKEQFKEAFLDHIQNPSLKEYADECLSDSRARNRITMLSKEKDGMLPIYALYSFFDYGFDRLNENINEFGLNNSPYVPILLSLWALKNGMKDIYEEFKNPEIVYACDKKISDWLGEADNLISFDTFSSINKIQLKQDEFIVGNYRCSYININIEYEFCVGKSVDQIEKTIEKLEKILKNTFAFQYVDFKQAIRKRHMTKVNIDLYSDLIHKNYLALTRKEKTKKKKEIKQNKAIEMKNLSLFDNLNKEDKKTD